MRPPPSPCASRGSVRRRPAAAPARRSPGPSAPGARGRRRHRSRLHRRHRSRARRFRPPPGPRSGDRQCGRVRQIDHGGVTLAEGVASAPRRSEVHAVPIEDAERLVRPRAGVDGHQGAAGPESAVEVLRIGLGHAHAHQRSDDPPGGGAQTRAGERRTRARRRPRWARRRESAASPAARSARQSARRSTRPPPRLGRRAAGGLEQVALLVGVLHCHADLVVAETGLLEVANGRLRIAPPGNRPTTVRPVSSCSSCAMDSSPVRCSWSVEGCGQTRRMAGCHS